MRTCTRCIMNDSADPTITFDEKPHSTTVETAPQEDSSMPSEGDYNDWYEYFRRFFGG